MTSPHSPTTRPASNAAGPRNWLLVLALDLVLISVFAALGRQSHEHGLAAVGILLTALPFLLACLAGWAVMRAWRRPVQLWPAGVVIWLVTVAAGLGIRALAGGGTAVSFQIVTLLVLGAFLMGQRLLWLVVLRSAGPARQRRRIN